MITDHETNKLYLSDCLKTKFPKFYQGLESELRQKNVNVSYLKGTKDIWARDYMPIQIEPKKFVQFRYEPDYLMEYPDIRTKPSDITKKLPDDWEIKTSELIVDGGNVIRYGKTFFMVEKVFHENHKLDVKDVIEKLYEVLEADRIIFLPWDDDDFTGHADGIVRFIDKETVMINEESTQTNPYFDVALRSALHNAGFKWEELPIFIPDDPIGISARGLYLNYLEIGNLIFAPIYGLSTDKKAIDKLNEIFKENKKIIPIASSDIAREGGVLNCISWNILE